MKFNINNYATVTLTEFGAKVYNSRYDDIVMPYEYKPKHVEAGHVLRAQLWTLFQDFGPHIHLGCINPFEQCTIEFDERDFKE